MEMYHNVSELSLFEIKANVEDRQLYFLGKRVMDILLSILFIILSMPLQILIALCIKLTSVGPVLYFQSRVGKDGKQFTIFKFRTMYKDVPFLLDKQSEEGTCIKYRADSRVTPLGKFLRKTSLDEIPQFYNVLFGSMSMVGPRPLVECMLSPYYDLNEIRASVKPGITGLWQISNRENCQNLMDMIDYDFQYISNANLLLDLKIVIATIWVVVLGKGAY